MRAYFFTVGQILRKAPAPKQCPFCGRILIGGPGRGLLYCNPCSELAEWFPPHLSYTLTGDSGTGKSIWLYQVADYYLRIASPRVRCVFVTLDDMPDRIRRQAAPYVQVLPAMEAKGDIVFVDGYSALAGAESAERYAVTDVTDLGALSDLLSRFAQEGYDAFFLDSLTPLATMATPTTLARGLVTMVARLKSDGATVFLTAAPTIGEDSARQLRSFTDALLEFRHSASLTTGMLTPLGLARWLRGPTGAGREQDPLREFRFYKARGRPIYPGWIPFVIAKDGLFIVLPDDPVTIQQIHEEVVRLDKMT